MATEYQTITYKTKIGRTNFSVLLFRKGCRLTVFRNEKHLLNGQWFPDTKKLKLDTVCFEDIKIKLENFLKVSVNNKDITFPYFGF